jgi:flagellar hook-associated protein 2
MSFTQPLSGIRFSGLSSGIDVESIVTQLVRIEGIGRQRIESQKAQVEAKQIVYGQLRSQLVSLAGSVSSLNTSTAYENVQATSSNKDAADITVTGSGSPGVYSLKVSQLAQAHKISSAAFETTTAAIGESGSFSLNGKEITVEAADTLQTLAGKINSAKAGVRASLINGGEGQAFMTLTADKSGQDNAIQLTGFTGAAGAALGLNGVQTYLNQPAVDRVRSAAFASATAPIAGFTAKSGVQNFTIDGQAFAFDVDSGSLEDLADAVNAAFAGSPERAVARVIDDGGQKRLELEGDAIPAELEDADGLFQALGFTRTDPFRELTAAQNAEYSLDGIAFTSASNGVTTVIPGATLTLRQADPEKTITLSVTEDRSKVKQSLQSLVDSYNGLNSYIRQNSEFNTDTFQGGPLLGDSVVAQIQTQLTSALFSDIGSGDYRNLADLGVLFDSDGNLKLDSARLDAVLADDPEAVRRILADTGSTTASSLVFVNGSSKAKSSGSSGYEVSITQAATKSQVLAGLAPASPNVGGEVLTFSGSLFGSSSFTITSGAGDSLQDLADKVNVNSSLKDRIQARVEGGKLLFESKGFGSSTAFSVKSNLAAANDNSGVGTSGGAETPGLNVAGTINGEAATGSGQFLIGSSGNASTDGLQVQYTGSGVGVVGNVIFTAGLSQKINGILSSFTDSVDGTLTATDNTLKDQIADYDKRIEDLATELELREAFLRQRFAVMEQSIASMNAQQAQLSAITSGSQ